MKAIRDPDAKTFLEKAGPLLYEREDEYGLALGLAEGLNSWFKPEVPPLLLRIEENQKTTAVLMQTRIDNCVLSHVTEEQARVFAAYMKEHDLKIEGAVGPTPGVNHFCRFYSSTPTNLRMGSRILALRNVIAPRPAPGELRLATLDDFAIVLKYTHAFYLECIPKELPTEAKLAQMMKEKIEQKTYWLWVINGEAVAQAGTTRRTRNGISIAAVYTPPEYRGKGYASNMMAALSQRLLDEGRQFCALYTDIANPTSNKIYESVGYQIVGTSEYLSYV